MDGLPKNSEFGEHLSEYWGELMADNMFADAYKEHSERAFLTYVVDQVLPDFPRNPDYQKTHLMRSFMDKHPNFDIHTYAMDLQYAAKFPSDIANNDVLTEEASEFNVSLYLICNELLDVILQRGDDVSGRNEYCTVKKLLIALGFAEQYADGTDVVLREVLDEVWTQPESLHQCNSGGITR